MPLLTAKSRQWSLRRSVQLPRFVPDTPSSGVELLTANVLVGSADPDALATLASDRADILVLQKLTPDLAAALDNRIAADLDSDQTCC